MCTNPSEFKRWAREGTDPGPFIQYPPHENKDRRSCPLQPRTPSGLLVTAAMRPAAGPNSVTLDSARRDLAARQVTVRGPRWTKLYVDVIERRRPQPPQDAPPTTTINGPSDSAEPDTAHPAAATGASGEGRGTVIRGAETTGRRVSRTGRIKNEMNLSVGVTSSHATGARS